MAAYKTYKRLDRGSITVEASIITPIIILSILAVIYAGFILYQRALLQSAAGRAAQDGAASWKNVSAEVSTGKTKVEELADGGLYWRLFEAEREDKLRNIKKYAEALMAGCNLLRPESSAVAVDIKDYIIYKRLEVTMENSYLLPVSSIMKMFGSSGQFKLTVSSFAVIDDPAELIRNTDFIVDIEGELEKRYPDLKDLGDKTRGVFGKIKENIDKFLE